MNRTNRTFNNLNQHGSFSEVRINHDTTDALLVKHLSEVVVQQFGFRDSERDTILKTMRREADGDLSKAIYEAASKHSHVSATKTQARTRVTVPAFLTADEQAILVREYPELQLVFTNTAVQGSHALAWADRFISTEILITMAGVESQIVDIGGNYATHVGKGRMIHSCCPVIVYRDASRNVLRHAQLGGYKAGGKKSARVTATLEAFYAQPSDFYCENRAEDCRFPASVGIAVHSTYDIPMSNLPLIMHNHGMRKLFGIMTYSDKVRYNDEGILPSHGVHYTVGEHFLIYKLESLIEQNMHLIPKILNLR